MNVDKGDDLTKVIEDNFHKFSRGQKSIARFVIDHYDKAAFMTAAKIGHTVDVSESTVVRFATALGYSGFPELQKALQIMTKNKLTTVQRLNLDDDTDNSKEFVEKVLKNEINSLKNLSENLDQKKLDEATDLIFNANKIYIVGMRISYTLALYLGFYLDVIMDNVKVINFGSFSLFDQMVRISEDDLLICVSYPRYSKQTIDAANFAKERNAKILTITDTESSPFYNMSDVALLGKSNMATFVDSLVTPMALINSLIVNIGLKEKDDIIKYFDLLEDVWEKYSIYNQDFEKKTNFKE